MRSIRTCLVFVAAAVLALIAPAGMRAGVTRVEITSRQDVLGGKAFGNTGAYEKLYGKVYFAVDPNNPHNKIIADLDKAPRNAQGKVEFSADLFMLVPKDQSKGNGVAFFDVVNRGNKGLLGTFNRAKASTDPSTELEYGDGYLMRQGYTVVAVGWQFDLTAKNKIALQAPIATDNGKVITGWVSQWVIPNKPAESIDYTNNGYNTASYPPLNPKDPAYRLTTREGWVAAQTLVPRDDWQFGKMQNGQVTYDPNWITVKGGIQAGVTYTVTYESSNPPVAGLGFAAIRDFASALKNDPTAPAHVSYAYTEGSSQTGRYQRQLIYEGFTIDEQGKKAIDALFIQTGGTSLGSFNERFAYPNELGSFTQTKFPIRYETTTDPVTGKQDGLGARIPAGLEPKVFLVDTESEYWDRGRVAALRHLSLDGKQDLSDPPNERVFMLAGTKHGSGGWPPAPSEAQPTLVNPIEYRWAQRALLDDLDQWVRKGVAPPPSLHPMLADGSLVAQADIKYPALPGVKFPTNVPGGYRADLPGPLSPLPFIVPRPDADGNDANGLRLPEQAVPLGTYTGWAFRSEKTGSPKTLVAMAGSYFPFAATKAEREKDNDPRPSIAERYPSKADYLQRVEKVANELVQHRYLLADDVKPVVAQCAEHWDWSTGGTAKPKNNVNKEDE